MLNAKRIAVHKTDRYRVNIAILRKRLGMSKLKSKIKVTRSDEKHIYSIRAKERARASIA